MPQLVGVVLAGGRGGRLGRTKGDLVVDGVVLAERAAATLARLCGAVLISTAPGAPNPAPGFPAVEDPAPGGLGPLAGIRAAFAASGRADLLVLACDYPRVGPQLLRSLVEGAAEEDELVFPVDGRGRDHPLVGLWRRSVEPKVREALEAGLPKVRTLLAEVRACRLGAWELAGIDLDSALLNLNTRADLDALG
jgi:molybdopterin-guanine dinucleotide biosynthesis protein A